MQSIPKIVLDTNVVLDWLLYENPGAQPLRAAIEANRVTVLTNALTREELKRVLGYSRLQLELEQQEAIFARYEACGTEVTMPQGFARANLQLPDDFPQCRDRDDQHLLALAFHAQADLLLTRDKAVLNLRKRAARFDVTIASLEEFATHNDACD